MEGGKEQNYWPGFVDALSNVVLTLVFVLVIFVFALLIASNKVEKKMTEVVAAEKAQKESQAQLDQALAELQQIRGQDQQSDPKKPLTAEQSQQQQACLRFAKSDNTQKADVSVDATSIMVTFSTNAISVTEDTNKILHDFIEAYKAKTGNISARFVIESPEDASSTSPLMARETQLGRMLNLRNSLLGNQIEPRNISIHSVAAQEQNGSYNWVKIYVEK